MDKIKLNADASNWSEVTNVSNYGRTFIAPNGKEFILIKHKKAHTDEYGNFKSGAQATVTINIDGSIQTFATPKLKDICGVMKESKNGTSSVKTNTATYYHPVNSESVSNVVNEPFTNTYQTMPTRKYKDLSIGDYSEDGKIEVVDVDRLSYRVFSSSKGATGIRTISKAILNEFVNYVADHPDASADDARNYLSGKTDTDKYEYGYAVTIMKMARMVIAKGVAKSLPIYAEQVIYYGCPGSGKSYKVKKITEKVDENFVFRTTFHPDTDYASFVGCYKPISNSRGLLNGNDLTEDELLQCFFDSKDESKYKGDIKARYFYEYLINTSNIRRLGLNATDISKKLKEKGFDKTPYVEATLMGKVYDWLHEDGYVTEESTIAYKFCPQVFTNAYVQAWKNPEEKVYLIIEEINRGNCAQIFGDLFQLLDRDKTGKSEYPIKADRDLAEYLRKVLAVTGCEGIEGGKLCLPSNLIIYATMNTSDQSLFPMDSAFKRRWDWEYVPIEYEAVKSDGKPNESYNYIITIDDEHKYRWVDFLKIVNKYIYDTTHSEDKQMGNFFIKKSVSAQEFINKVMFYLWNEVCKEEAGTSRNFFRVAVEANNDGKEFKFVDLFDKANTNNLLIGFMSHLKVGKYTE